MKDTAALILASGQEHGYGVLTLNRAKSSVHFGANYRLIDFALSNLSNSGIDKVGIIIQYLPASLIEYVGIGRPWEFVGVDRVVKIMPPFMGIGNTSWFKGSANALYQNLNFIDDWNPKEVIVLFGDQIFYLNFANVLKYHREKNADLTIVVKTLDSNDSRTKVCRFGKIKVNESTCKITDFGKSPIDEFSNICSTGVYVFKKEILTKYLTECENAKIHSLSNGVIVPVVKNENTYAYFHEEYWNCVSTISDYYKANMSLLEENPEIKINEWDVVTNVEYRQTGYRASSYFDVNSEIKNSLLSSGCVVKGKVENSIISTGVVIEKDAVVKDSIIMHDCVIQSGASLCRTISDKDVIFGKNCQVGEEGDIHSENPELPIGTFNLTLIGKAAKIPDDFVIKSSSQIYPAVNLAAHHNKVIDRGTNVKS